MAQTMRRLDVLHAAIISVFSAAIAFSVSLDLQPAYFWTFIGGLVLSFPAMYWFNRVASVRPAASGWLEPISERAGNRTFELAIAAVLMLDLPLVLGMLFLAFRQAPSWGMAGLGGVGAALIVGWLLQRKLSTRSIWPYALTLSIAVFGMFGSLSRLGVLKLDA